MGRRAAVLGAVDRPLSGASLQRLRGRRGARARRRRPSNCRRSSRRPGATGATTSAACTSASTTSARSIGTREAFAADHAQALGFLARRCDRVLALTAPLRLGRPPADAKVPSLNAIITRNAAAHGALVVDLGDFGARNQVMVDYVHPTAFGQIAIAERALAVLAADGLPARVSPASLISYRDHPLAAAPRGSDLRLPRPQAAHPGGGAATRGTAALSAARADAGRPTPDARARLPGRPIESVTKLMVKLGHGLAGLASPRRSAAPRHGATGC